MSTLKKYARNIHSQNGEDGILAEILRRLKIETGWACEFGAWDGKHLSNTFHLIERGWNAVLIEGEPDRFATLVANMQAFGERVHSLGVFVETDGAHRLDALLAQTPIPREFDVLSIDIDSCDWQIWNSLEQYRPTVVLIEINPRFPPGEKHIHTPEIPGSSFASTLELGRQKGYTLVCATVNMVFVRNDRVPMLGLPARELAHPELLFCDRWLPTHLVRPWYRRLLKWMWRTFIVRQRPAPSPSHEGI